MTAVAAKEAINQSFNNPLSGVVSVCVFVLLVILSTSIAFLFCSELLTISNTLKSNILQIFLFTIFIGWLTFTASDDGIEFILMGLVTGLCCFVFIGML